MTRLLRVHRWFGLVACFGVLLWGSSGILHPIMSRLQPRPAVATPPPQSVSLRGAAPLADVLARQGLGEIESLRALAWDGNVYWQIGIPGAAERRYVDAHRGAVLADGDRRYAALLARHFLGDTRSPIASIELIDHFDDDYPYVNRLLPVYRVRFERADGMRVYVDTGEARLATLVDDTKAWMNALFRTLHNWEFMGRYPAAQAAIMSVFLLAAFVTAVLGIVLYGFSWRTVKQRLQARALQRTHRVVGIAVSVTTLTFTFSGAYHLWKTFERDRETHPPHAQRFTVADVTGIALPAESYARVTLARLNDGAYFQLAHGAPAAAGGEHDHHHRPREAASPAFSYRHARSGAGLEGGVERHARQLAAFYSGLPDNRVVSVSAVTRFEGEYGFIFKRLPVYRVEYETPDHARYYVEPSTGALAARIDDGDALEGKTFSYLHKWHISDSGKDLRDSLLALFALGNVSVAMMGLTLFARRRWRAEGGRRNGQGGRRFK